MSTTRRDFLRLAGAGAFGLAAAGPLSAGVTAWTGGLPVRGDRQGQERAFVARRALGGALQHGLALLVRQRYRRAVGCTRRAGHRLDGRLEQFHLGTTRLATFEVFLDR